MSQIFSTVIPVPESAEIRAKGICGLIQGSQLTTLATAKFRRSTSDRFLRRSTGLSLTDYSNRRRNLYRATIAVAVLPWRETFGTDK
jgi:hypothetical protein